MGLHDLETPRSSAIFTNVNISRHLYMTAYLNNIDVNFYRCSLFDNTPNKSIHRRKTEI